MKGEPGRSAILLFRADKRFYEFTRGQDQRGWR